MKWDVGKYRSPTSRKDLLPRLLRSQWADSLQLLLPSGFPQHVAMPKHTPFHPFIDKLMAFLVGTSHGISWGFGGPISQFSLQRTSYPSNRKLAPNKYNACQTPSQCLLSKKKNWWQILTSLWNETHLWFFTSFANQLGARIQVDG